MANRISFSSVYSIFIGLFLLIALIFPKLIVLGFIGFIALVVVGMIKKKMFFKINYFSWFFISLYLLYLVYAIFTRHSDLAGRYIENKLSFLILPFLVSFHLKDKIKINYAIIGYLIAVFILLIEYYLNGIICFLKEGTVSCFFSSSFSFSHHPSYTSVFLIFAMGLIVYAWNKKLSGFKLFWIIPSMIVLFLSTFLCLSLAGILFLFLLIGVILLVLIYKKWGKLATVLAAIITPIALYFTLLSIPQVEGEWTGAKWYANEYLKDKEAFVQQRKYPMSGTEVRLVMWTVSSKVLSKYPLGVGTGNVDEILTYNLKKMDQKELAKQELNPHNQYLQTGIEIGWLGIIVLLMITVYGTFKAIQNRNWLLVLILCNLSFNMLFESMLQRQSGIVFYTFVILILANIQKNIKSENT